MNIERWFRWFAPKIKEKFSKKINQALAPEVIFLNRTHKKLVLSKIEAKQ